MKRIRSVDDLWHAVAGAMHLVANPYYDPLQLDDVSQSEQQQQSSDTTGTVQWEYLPEPCEADALATCSSKSSNVVFEDLDRVSYPSFLNYASHNTKGSLVIFYTPNAWFDAYFIQPSSVWQEVVPALFSSAISDTRSRQDDDTVMQNYSTTTTWLQDDATSPVETIVGRVNCLESPSICDWRSRCYEFPCLRVIYPKNRTIVKNSTNNVGYPYEATFDQYDSVISDCLWRRFGAHELSNQCQARMTYYHRRSSSPRSRSRTVPTICIQQGQRIVVLWNAGIVTVSLLLLFVLARLGRGLIRKCCIQWCCCCTSGTRLLIVKNSARLNKEERKVQVGQLTDCFLVASLVIGIINMYFPYLIMVVAGPVSLVLVVWLWWTELKTLGRSLCLWAMSAGARGPATTTFTTV